MSLVTCAAPLWFFLLALVPVVLLGFYLGRFWHTFTGLYSPQSLRHEAQELMPLYQEPPAERSRSAATPPGQTSYS